MRIPRVFQELSNLFRAPRRRSHVALFEAWWCDARARALELHADWTDALARRVGSVGTATDCGNFVSGVSSLCMTALRNGTERNCCKAEQ